MDIGRPYTEQLEDGCIIRTFDSNLDPDELYWHRDKVNRVIEVLSGEGWKLQIDNEIPFNIVKRGIYIIPKEVYHRILKGSNNLILKIFEQ